MAKQNARPSKAPRATRPAMDGELWNASAGSAPFGAGIHLEWMKSLIKSRPRRVPGHAYMDKSGCPVRQSWACSRTSECEHSSGPRDSEIPLQIARAPHLKRARGSANPSGINVFVSFIWARNVSSCGGAGFTKQHARPATWGISGWIFQGPRCSSSRRNDASPHLGTWPYCVSLCKSRGRCWLRVEDCVCWR